MGKLAERQRGGRIGPEREPHYTIYGSAWDDARARVDALPTPELRGTYAGLLDYVEAGWAILRPLQREAETILAWRRSHADPATAVAAYVDGDVTDEWRGIAFRCRDAVPGLEGAAQELAAYCPADEAESVLRYLLVLGMASGDPCFPVGLQSLVPGAVEAFRQWVEGFPAVLAPVEDVEDAAQLYG